MLAQHSVHFCALGPQAQNRRNVAGQKCVKACMELAHQSHGHDSLDHKRRRAWRTTARAIIAWSTIPFVLLLVSANEMMIATSLFLVVVAALVAAALSQTTSQVAHIVASVLLAVVSFPFCVSTVRALCYASGPGFASVADSPLGFMIGIGCRIMLAVPPASFAVALFRDRARKNEFESAAA